MRSDNLYAIPGDIPVPEDDGGASHLPGCKVPSVKLKATNGEVVDLGDRTRRLAVVYCYPRTGLPDREALGGTQQWNAIPGARGCTPQACAYRDSYQELVDLGVQVFGVSTQSNDDQREAVERLHLPFSLLSDEQHELLDGLQLPFFKVEGVKILKRLTMILREGRVVHCFYPIFPPDADVANVIAWIRANAGR